MAKAIEGDDGWLFLGNDTNASVDQFCGKFNISDRHMQNWSEFFVNLNEQADLRKTKSVMLIAPSKENVFPQYYPFKRAKVTPIEQILSLDKQTEVIYPIEALGQPNLPLLTYSKTDTHWTDFGAHLAADMAIRFFGGSPGPIELEDFVTHETMLDLGNKVAPMVKEVISVHKRAYRDGRVFDNLIHNHGRIWIYENKDAELGTCVLSGDSFSVLLCKRLGSAFRRFIYIHSTAVDWGIIDKEKPEFLISQVAERFLIRPPSTDPNFCIKETIRAKIQQSDPQLRTQQTEAFSKYFGEAQFDAP